MNFAKANQNIVVFGSTGMVGSAIFKALKNKGYMKILSPKSKELNLLNLRDTQNWFKKFKPEIVILCAAKVGGIYSNNIYPADFILENLKIQTNVIETSWKYGVKKFLFLGSSCIYPKFSQQPIVEEELLNGYLEKTNQWYAIAKISGIKLCEALRIQYGFNAISLMPTNLYGPGDNFDLSNGHVLASLIRRFYEAKFENKSEVICWGSGSPRREFLHVNDLANAIIFVLENWDIDNPLSPKDRDGNLLPYLNVGTGKDISIKELAILVSELIGFKGKIRWDNSKPDGTPRKLLDVGRINKMGWKYEINFKSGLESFIEYFGKEVYGVKK